MEQYLTDSVKIFIAEGADWWEGGRYVSKITNVIIGMYWGGKDYDYVPGYNYTWRVDGGNNVAIDEADAKSRIEKYFEEQKFVAGKVGNCDWSKEVLPIETINKWIEYFNACDVEPSEADKKSILLNGFESPQGVPTIKGIKSFWDSQPVAKCKCPMQLLLREGCKCGGV